MTVLTRSEGRGCVAKLTALLLGAGVLVGTSPPGGAAAAEPLGPNYTVFSGVVLSMCGEHVFGDLTIQSGAPGGTIKVASAPDAANPTGTGPNCPAGSEGRLTIVAEHLTNHGTLDASAVNSTPVNPTPYGGAPATNHGGGGHGGAGGDGGHGSGGGSAYGDWTRSALSEVGAPGAGATDGSGAGRGGGLLIVRAQRSVVSDGKIVANGGDGADSLLGACGFTSTQSSESGPIEIYHPNTGGVGAGGGGGGGIVLTATTLDLRGTSPLEFQARGGSGGQGRFASGGSGGGGVVKLLAAIQRVDAGFTPDVSGGPQVPSLCPEEPRPGHPGGAGIVVVGASGFSVSPSPIAFGDVSVGASEALTATLTNTGNSDLHVFAAALSGDDGFASEDDTCSGATVAPADSCSVTVRFTPGAPEALSAELTVDHDAATTPAVITVTGTGVDTTPPDTTITAGPGTSTTDTTPTFEFTSSESGSTFACKIDAADWQPCASPFTTPELSDGAQGEHLFRVRATDRAGNTDPTPASRTFVVVAPTKLVALPASVTVENLLWLRLQPTATLTHARTGLPLPGKPIVFSVGTRVICTATTNAQGMARCTGLLPLIGTVVSLGYDARYLGATGFAPAYARGSLVTVGGATIR